MIVSLDNVFCSHLQLKWMLLTWENCIKLSSPSAAKQVSYFCQIQLISNEPDSAVFAQAKLLFKVMGYCAQTVRSGP